MACDDIKSNRFYTRRFKKKNVQICAYYKVHIFIVCVISVKFEYSWMKIVAVTDLYLGKKVFSNFIETRKHLIGSLSYLVLNPTSTITEHLIPVQYKNIIQ